MTLSLDSLKPILIGPDCSHYQPQAGPLDLSVTRATPMYYLGWKATQSVAYVDPTFATYRDIANVLRFEWLLPYHWLSSTTDPVDQADHYLATIGTFRPGEGAMLDVEEAGTTVEKCLAWFERVEAVTTRPSSCYTGIYVAGGTIWTDPRIRNSKYGPRMMHLAAYVSPANLYARLSQKRLLELPLDAWQYSSNGPVPGITGRCDMNSIFNLAGYNTVVAPPVPWPAFNPAAGQFGLYPIAPNKPWISWTKNSNGDIVRYLQGVILWKAGGNISVDGVFGSQTDRRVRDLQRLFHLTIDGIVGPQTWAAVDYLSKT